MTASATTPDRLRSRARDLAFATIAWNTVEAFVAIGSGIAAGSIALVGFGLDSTIEVFAASVALWFLRSHQEREQRALRLIAASYFVLAGYVTLEALRDLFVEVAGWVAARVVDERVGHPWLVSGPAFAARLARLTGDAVRAR
ncbi:MAG: hypothetical protein ACR2LQ_03040 [Acidimicrobiales bacterium]